MMVKEVLLAHDLGTAGNKAALVTPEGEIVDTAYQEYRVDIPRPGWAEQDPQVWWDAIKSTTNQLMDGGGFEKDVLAVSFDAMVLSAIPVDQDGNPLRPAIIWLDTRAKEETEEFAEIYDLEDMLDKDIIPPLSPKDPIPKIMWIKNNEPGIFEETHMFLEAKGFLINKCTGEFVTDPSEASLTGTFSLSNMERVPGIPESIGVDPNQLPEIRESTDVIGTTTKEASGELGLPQDVPVICGTGDPTAAAIGSGAVREGEPHMYIGSSGWIALHTKELRFGLSGVGTICSADPDKFLLIGQSESCASCYEWFKNELSEIEEKKANQKGVSTFEVMDNEAKSIPPGSNGLLFMPWMSGERCPFIDPTIRGGFLNLSVNHGKKDMIRSVLEGVAYNIRWIMEELIEMGYSIGGLSAVGGGAKSDLWLQIMSDVLDKEVYKMPNPAYAGCVGTALISALGLDIYSSFNEFEDLFEPEKSFSPNPENVETYNTIYEQFRGVRIDISKACSELNKGL